MGSFESTLTDASQTIIHKQLDGTSGQPSCWQIVLVDQVMALEIHERG